MQSLLKVEHVEVSFDGVKALQDISFVVKPGQLFALVGPNGAGKTTLFNCICRIVNPDRGAISFKDNNLLLRKSHQVPELGIARTFQNIELFSGLTTLQNIMVGHHRHNSSSLAGSYFRLRSSRAAEIESRRAAEELIDFLELDPVRHISVENLPYGIRKKIELGRALATKPELLLLDEPVAGMNIEEREELAFWLKEIRTVMGITILLVEHDMRLVTELSDEICVLDSGKVIAAGSPSSVQKDPAVIEAYLGRSANES